MQVFILNELAIEHEDHPVTQAQSVWSTHEKAREAAERIEAGRASHVNSNDGRGKTAFTITVETVDPTNI